MKYPKNVSYPLYQCAKNSSASYVMRPIPHTFSKIILQLRNIVKTTYKNKVIDIDSMFNVIVYNYHQIQTIEIINHQYYQILRFTATIYINYNIIRWFYSVIIDIEQMRR